MWVAISFSGMDVFEKDLENLKPEDEQHLNASQIAEELREELERLGYANEESHVYRTSTHEFHFRILASYDFTLTIKYTGYTEYS